MDRFESNSILDGTWTFSGRTFRVSHLDICFIMFSVFFGSSTY